MECLGGVFARERAGFGGREEDLLARVGVDGEVVDGFVWGWVAEFRSVGGLGEHGEDGLLVGFGEWFALRDDWC